MKNEEASDRYCKEELDRLSKDFMENISTYSVPGGHRLYMGMREKIEHDYWQVPRKGVKVRSMEDCSCPAATENWVPEREAGNKKGQEGERSMKPRQRVL